MAVDVTATGAAFQAGVPKQLFALPPNVGDWDVTGRRQAVPRGSAAGAANRSDRPHRGAELGSGVEAVGILILLPPPGHTFRSMILVGAYASPDRSIQGASFQGSLICERLAG